MSKHPSSRASRERVSQLKSAVEDAHSAKRLPETPQTASPTYRLAFEDPDFLRSDALRAVRLQLELEKPESIMRALGLNSTVIMFGGARIPAPNTPARGKSEKARERLERASKYYVEAEKFAHVVTQHSIAHEAREFVIVTGGGPGIMEAGNKGALEAGGSSVGLSIVLPHENAPNMYVTPELSFNFHYFAIRKMHFLMRAKAITVFPGGYGTLDELFEALTLIQTKRMAPIPVLLFGESFWREIINFEALADWGTIAPDDLKLFRFVETADEAWRAIAEFYKITDPE